jgi:hypothetical protein
MSADEDEPGEPFVGVLLSPEVLDNRFFYPVFAVMFLPALAGACIPFGCARFFCVSLPGLQLKNRFAIRSEPPQLGPVRHPKYRNRASKPWTTAGLTGC